MWYYPLTALITMITSSILGFFVYFKNKKNPANRSYAAFNFSVTIWSYAYFMWQISDNAPAALFWCRALMAGAIFIPIYFFQFVVRWLGLEKSNRRMLIFGYFIFTLFFLLNFTPLFIEKVSPRSIFKFWPIPGIGFHSFLVFWIGYASDACFLLFKERRYEKGIKRVQINYVLIGMLFGYLGGSTNYFLWYDIPILPIGNGFAPVYVGMVAYAILRHRLMDISVAITRTGIFIAVYTLVLGLPFAVATWFKKWLINTFGISWWMLPLILMAVLATVGPFIYIYLQRKAEERLLREQKRYQDSLKQASVGMTRIRNLKKLLDLITHIVTKTVKIAYVGIYLYNEEANEYILQVSRDKGRTPVPNIAKDNALIKWLILKREPLIYEEIKRHAQDFNDHLSKELEEEMRLLTAMVIIPSFLEDRLLGVIVLGEKISGRIYTPEDLNVFQVLASQAALAIENAQFYEEAKEMQEQIAQAEKMATIGTMADGLSHQINNRFYALSLIAGDSIDTIKLTDTSQCSPEIKEMISSINHALERIQTNVMQGGEVVKGILKYTRKGEEGFEALNLDRIIDGTLDMVQYKVKLSEFDILRNYPKDTPKIKGNLVQLQEVFFNFIDNAYDAMVERRTMLKEEGYRGKIAISARPSTDTTLEIIVEDNGMGIKEDNEKKIFTPFFTTKTSSRRGTGLGLYVIRRIISDTHKGKISFESTYNLGTRFIVELPISY